TSEILTLFRDDQLFPPFIYRTVRMKGITGCTYQLTVETRGRIITASTTIPEPPIVNGLSMEAESDSSGNLTVSVQPSQNEDLRLFLQTKSKLADQNFHPVKMPVIKVPAGETAQKINIDRMYETNLYLIDTKRNYYKDWDRYSYSLKDTVMVKVGTIDMKSYQVFKSLYADQSNQLNPFAFNTGGIQTNIVGGIGRWTGIGLAPLKIYYGE
ncbi:MAG: hypothetical protein PHS30_10825, partial [Bacteroidales bacterium]|nr:hypothetical protein [Bacteroidales bacterium]